MVAQRHPPPPPPPVRQRRCPRGARAGGAPGRGRLRHDLFGDYLETLPRAPDSLGRAFEVTQGGRTKVRGAWCGRYSLHGSAPSGGATGAAGTSPGQLPLAALGRMRSENLVLRAGFSSGPSWVSFHEKDRWDPVSVASELEGVAGVGLVPIVVDVVREFAY